MNETEIFLIYDPNRNNWTAQVQQHGTVQTLVTGPSMEFVLQNVAMQLGKPVMIRVSAEQ